MNILLVGYRGSGKTTIGALTARRLGFRFVDLDDLIVKQANQSIREIFDAEGEKGFRLKERAALQSLRRVKNHVIALGGGTIVDPEMGVLARRIGRIVYLRAPAAVLWARVSRDPQSLNRRPDLTAAGGLTEVETVLRDREPLYESVSHHIIDTLSQSPETVAEAIELWAEANDADAE